LASSVFAPLDAHGSEGERLMQEIAEVYARSLFEVAKEHDVLDDLHEQLGQFADALDESRELQVFFFSPYFSSEEKKDAIGKLVEGADEHFVRFLEMLAERHRMPVVFRIRREFDALWADENRLLPVTITSAVELDRDTVKKIQKEIEDQTGRRTELTTEVDPDVLGGLSVQVGNAIMDGTVRARLDRLRRQVLTAA
jgi:ATP synthase F1 delta subunit